MMTDQASNRGLHILLAGVVAVAFAGFLVGTAPPPSPEPPAEHRFPDPNEQREQAVAPDYEAMRVDRVGPNADWRSDLSALSAALPARTDPVEVTEEERDAAWLARLDNRAYDGAPPTIPHPINSVGVPECAACHTDGLIVDGRVARAMSHPYYTSCTQCHVRSQHTFGGRPSEGALEHAQETTAGWGGFRWPRHGEVATIGTAPTIPHPTWMRQNCDSCHGVAGAHGLRSTHPERQECVQCHAPSAVLDQRPVAAGLALFP